MNGRWGESDPDACREHLLMYNRNRMARQEHYKRDINADRQCYMLWAGSGESTAVGVEGLRESGVDRVGVDSGNP